MGRSAAERVLDVLQQQAPSALCNDCIANELGFSKRQQAYQITSVLGLTRDYVRDHGTCARCGCRKLVITSLVSSAPTSHPVAWAGIDEGAVQDA